jgi:hypothetical protein
MMTGAIMDFDQSVRGAYEAAPQPATPMMLPEAAE